MAACVRTKDAGRFLPEWIAYHQAIGVDELTLYDDDSVDETKEVTINIIGRFSTQNNSENHISILGRNI